MISVVIVNYNAGALLRQNIDRLRLVSKHEPLDIYIVDNASTDDSLSTLAGLDDNTTCRLHILRNSDNRGFACACNQGLRASEGEYILFLNPDCLLEPQALTQVRHVLEHHPDAGMAGGLILNPDGTEQRGCRRDIPNVKQSLYYVMQLHRIAPQRFSEFNRTHEALPGEPIDIGAISGAFMLIRRRAIETVDGWDEGYFLHVEDLDLCQRFHQHGYRILFVPDARAFHDQGSCTNGHSIKVERHKHQGMWRFYRKFQAPKNGLLLNIFVATGITVHFCLLATLLFFTPEKRRSTPDAS